MKNREQRSRSLNSIIKTTLRLQVAAESVNSPLTQQAIAQAAQLLRAGGTVAFPTETVYGLGANAFDAQAIAGIFLAKQRPSWDPLIVHVSGAAMLQKVVASISPRAQKLIDAFWPGPLTLLLPKSVAVPAEVTAGRALVGVRFPAHPVARALIAAAGVPIAAPSANRFGHTSPTTAQHVLDDLDGRIDLVIDNGPTQCGLESTVIEVSDHSITLYRPGAISAAQIESIAGAVSIYQPPANRVHLPPESLPSPGVGMRHYAPKAQVIPVALTDGPELAQQSEWVHAVEAYSAHSACVGVLLPTGWPLPPAFSGVRYDWGNWRNDGELARALFAGLRALDNQGVEQILCPLPSPAGMGVAIRDRILKASRPA